MSPIPGLCAHCDDPQGEGWVTQTGLPICRKCCITNMANNLGISEAVAKIIHEDQKREAYRKYRETRNDRISEDRDPVPPR